MFLLRGVRRCFNSQKDLKTLVPEKEDEGVSLLVEPNTDKLSEAGGVVVPNGLGVAVRLQDWVGLHHLVLQGGLLLLPLLQLLASVGADEGEVGNDLLGVLGLSSTGLSSNQDGLVDAGVVHALVGSLSNTEDVGPALGTPLAHVDLHGAEGVDREPLVGVDGDAEEAGVGVDQLVLVPHHGVPQDAGIAKEGQVGHVLGTVELGGVDLADGVRLVDLVLSVDIDGKLLASGEGVILDLLLRDALEVATDVLVWVGHPHWKEKVWSDI